jgi:UDP-N-acetylglucosamine 3-dehydrogenase
MPMTVRVGIIGAGKIGRIHAKAYGQRPEARIAAVADIDESAGQALATEYGAHYYRDYKALLLADLDAVSIGLPDRLHHPVAMAAAAAGKHILLEKPMCATLTEADEIIAACRSQGVKLMLAFRHRFHAEIQLAKRLIEEGQLGRIVLALDALSGGGPSGSGAWKPWYWDKKLAIGGILTSAGIHGIDRLRWLMGTDIQEVHSYMGTFGHKGELEDNLVASLHFESGAIGSIVQNFNFFTLPGKYDLEIYGTQGALRIRTGQTLEFANNDTHFVHSVECDDPFGKEIAEFVSAILQDREPAITGEDGKASLAVALTIYRSAEVGAPVRVEKMYKEKTT